jgi:rSAM/selenodomain-associated transferase 2
MVTGASSHASLPRLTISAIVPTWNEEAVIVEALESLRRGGVDEILVVDAGSDDGTAARARAIADRCLEGSGGLFAQLNAGARQAAGDVLLFHYADVLFPAAGRQAIESALTSPLAVGGAFRLSFASERWRYQVTARAANWRNRLRLGPFGDQSLFARAEVFHGLGGFRHDAFFEDLDLVNRLRRAGRFHIVPQAVRASVRRWESMGFLRTHITHYWLYALYLTRLGRPTKRARHKTRTLRAVR